MHTLIIEGTFKPGKKTEFVIAWNNEILPTLKKAAGICRRDPAVWDGQARCWGGIKFLEDQGRSRALSPRSIPESGWFCGTPPEWSSHCALIRCRGGRDFSHSPGEGSLASRVETSNGEFRQLAIFTSENFDWTASQTNFFQHWRVREVEQVGIRSCTCGTFPRFPQSKWVPPYCRGWTIAPIISAF